MCKLAALGMVLCSEVIEMVSLSGSRKVADETKNYKTIIQKYKG